VRRGKRLAWAVLVVCAFVAPTSWAEPALPLPGATGLVPFYEDPPPAYEWQGEWQSREVAFPSSSTGAELYGVLFAPADLSGLEMLPAVVIVPGSGPSVQSHVQWAARDLAGHGYLSLTVDPQGVGRSAVLGSSACGPARGAYEGQSPCPGVPFQQASNYVDAVVSGIDFLLSPENPFSELVDPSEIGAAGHSLAARGVSWLQGEDVRIKAIVAWDNLAKDVAGDDGTPSGGGPASTFIGGELPGTSHPSVPRVPAMGQASDSRGSTTPANDDPSQKKAAYEVWRAAGVATMEIVFRGASHFDWVQTNPNAKEPLQRLSAYYTRAWFDRYLRNDTSALERLLASSVNGAPTEDLLSEQFTSAAFLDGLDCPDLRMCVNSP